MSKGRRFTASLEVPSSRGGSPATISAPILINSPGPLMRNPASYAGINSSDHHHHHRSKRRSPSDSAIPAPAIVMASSAAASVYLPLLAALSSESADKPAEKQSQAADLSELKAEVARLQEREAALSHKLTLEKEQRVKAEQLVEVERMACLELKHRLHLEGKQGDEDGRKGSASEEAEDDIDFTKLNDDVSDILNVSSLITLELVNHLKPHFQRDAIIQ